MSEGALNLHEHVMPRVALRQCVLTVPYALRARLSYDGALLGHVCRVFTETVLGWYRRRMKDEGIVDGRSGCVAVVQRTSSDLKLNPHIHAVFVDGVFTRTEDEAPVFHALPRLSTDEVADLLQAVRVRILRLWIRRGVVDKASAEESALVPDPRPELDAALVALTTSAVSGVAPAGPEHRQRPEMVPEMVPTDE